MNPAFLSGGSGLSLFHRLYYIFSLKTEEYGQTEQQEHD
jgi:hypothetical protein